MRYAPICDDVGIVLLISHGKWYLSAPYVVPLTEIAHIRRTNFVIEPMRLVKSAAEFPRSVILNSSTWSDISD